MVDGWCVVESCLLLVLLAISVAFFLAAWHRTLIAFGFCHQRGSHFFVCHICVVVLLLQWQLLLLLLGPFLAFLLLAGPALFCVLFWLGGPVGQEGARLADCFI